MKQQDYVSLEQDVFFFFVFAISSLFTVICLDMLFGSNIVSQLMAFSSMLNLTFCGSGALFEVSGFCSTRVDNAC